MINCGPMSRKEVESTVDAEVGKLIFLPTAGGGPAGDMEADETFA